MRAHKKKYWLDAQIGHHFHIDPAGWTNQKKRGWLANHARLRAIDQLRAGNYGDLPLAELRKLCILAVDNQDLGERMAMDIFARRQIVDAGLSAYSGNGIADQ